MFADELHLVFTCSVVLIRRESRRNCDLHARRWERQQKQVSVKEVAHKDWSGKMLASYLH